MKSQLSTEPDKPNLFGILFAIVIALIAGTWLNSLRDTPGDLDFISSYFRNMMQDPTSFVLRVLPFALVGWVIVRRLPQKFLLWLKMQAPED